MFVKQLMERIDADALHFSCPFIRLQRALALPLGELSSQMTERSLALPLGELSPQVTERALPPVLNGNFNLFMHTTKIPVNIPVGEW